MKLPLTYGDLIIGVSVSVSDSNRDGEVCIDIRDIFKKENLVLRLQLPELVSAIASAYYDERRKIAREEAREERIAQKAKGAKK